MGVATPTALLLLLLLPLLWLRRAAPRTRMPVAALHLWEAALPDQTSVSPRRPRTDLIVVLRTAAAAALIIALAGPTVSLPGQHVALIVDVSASMGARDGEGAVEGRRFDAAVTRAIDRLDGMPLLTRVDLITAAAVPSLIGEYRATDARLQQALSRLAPRPEDADLDAAIRRAATGGATHVYVVTDRQAPPQIDRAALTWMRVGGTADNVALANLSYTRAANPSAPLQVLVSVINFGERAATRELVLSPPAGPPLRERLSIPPGERLTLVRSLPVASGRVTATIDGGDALTADDSRVLDITPAATRRVRLQNAEPAVERAIRAIPGVSIVDNDPTLLVCGRCAAAPAGANVLLTAPPGEAVAPESLLLMAPHPVSAALSLDGIRAAPIAGPIPSTATVIAVAGGVPAVVATETDGTRVVELRMDLSQGTLTLDPAFPILVANAVEWLAPAANEASAGGIPIAESDLRPAAASVTGVNPVVESTGPRSDATAPFLVAALILIAAEWLIGHRRHRARGRSVAVMPRAAALALLALAVAGLPIPGGTAPLTAVVVLDRSASMGSEARSLDRVAALSVGRRDDDRLGVVVFGATAGIERRPAEATALPAITSTVERGGTDIEAGLRVARAALPPGGSRRLVLVSDGRQTAGDALREAERAAREGIHIDVAPPRWLAEDSRPLTVTRVTAPPAVRAGEPFQITAVIEGAAGTRGDVVLRRNGSTAGAVPVTIPVAGITTIALDDRQTTAGAYEYQARVSRPEDDFTGTSPDEDGAGAVVVVTGEPRLLHVGARSVDLARLLAPAGFAVETIAPALLPRAAGALASYDAIVLDDVAGDEMDAAQGAALARYVEQTGGGLLILGSARSLEPGLGGQTALSAIAPVDFRPRGGQRAPAASLVVVFDKSGSMADLVDGAPKIEYARQAVEGVLHAVSPADLVGVIAFDATAVPVVPLEAGHVLESVKAELRRTLPAGSTSIGPALELARSWLQTPQALATARRHIFLVSDGRTSPADAERALAVAAQRGIEISTVALDAASDRDLLRALAERSSGRAYVAADASALPRLLAREASRVAGGRVVDEPFRVQIAAHAVTAGIGEGAGPTLGGYVVGAARPQAATALASPLGDPILATARAGLGRVGLYTADLPSAWSDGLRSWNRFPMLLTQTVRWVSRRTSTGGVFASVQGTDRGMRLVVEADAPDVVEVRVEIRRPGSDQVQTMTLDPIVPGRFAGSIDAAVPGPYLFAITATRAASEARLLRGYAWTAQRELASTGLDMTLLTDIARLTGGRILEAPDTPFATPRDRVWRPARPWLAAAALAILLAAWLSPGAA